ncbi:MAG: hypothetical protein L6R36_008274 [Xanthoria steineri]|nr:MAG: hypothetical protein L6R36_008279 [Xanthoria steineri]KAI4219509.1 MAG: hypothetical protein L6R36_008274 [Xanthoria steineri]
MPLPTTNHYTSPSRAHPNPQHPPNQNTTNNPPPPTSHHLTTLRHDETLIHNRKSNIRRFGAGWLRPPGIPKTLQGMADERAEREEQEVVAQREQAMIDAQTAADEEAAEAMGQEDAALMRAAAEEEGEVVDEDEMRDLDDLVPEGGGDAGWESSEGGGEDEEEEEEEEEGNQENERVGQAGADAVVVGDLDDGGFMGAQEEGEGDYAVPGMLEGEARDLDEDVPEAGSYQHTDTEVEDESSVEEGASFAIGAGGGVLGRSVWGGSPVGVMAGGYDGPAGVERRRASRRSNGRSRGGRLSRD